jgi:hypothetical protein
MNKHLKILKETEEEYKSIFGANSLDRVMLYEPFPSKKEAFDVVSTLKRAIETDQPLKQIDEEIWNKLVF